MAGARGHGPFRGSRDTAEIGNQPVARAGLRRHLDRRGEQPLAGRDEQWAQAEHPGGQPGRDRVPAAAGRRHVPAVHRDLDRSGTRDDPGGQRQAADQYQALRSMVVIARDQQVRGPVPQHLDRVTADRASPGCHGGRVPRVQVQGSGADSRFHVGHRCGQVSEQRGQVPFRARRGQGHLPRRDLRARAQRVPDRAGQERDRARGHARRAGLPCHVSSRGQPAVYPYRPGRPPFLTGESAPIAGGPLSGPCAGRRAAGPGARC
jgi:hypothetical protein